MQKWFETTPKHCPSCAKCSHKNRMYTWHSNKNISFQANPLTHKWLSFGLHKLISVFIRSSVLINQTICLRKNRKKAHNFVDYRLIETKKQQTSCIGTRKILEQNTLILWPKITLIWHIFGDESSNLDVMNLCRHWSDSAMERKRKRMRWNQEDKKLLRSSSRKLSRPPSLGDILKDTYTHSKFNVYFSNIVGLKLADLPDHPEVGT